MLQLMQKLPHSGMDAEIRSHGWHVSIASVSDLGIMPSHTFTSM